jgi:hypothetical protein
MLLTLRVSHPPEHGFGRLPGAPTLVDLPGGRAHLVHPSADTAAVVLEVDDAPGPGFPTPGRGAYAGLLSRALAAFLPAFAGDDEPRDIEVRITALWSPVGDAILRRIFEPLGYAVEAAPIPIDPAQPNAGRSGFWTLSLAGTQRPGDVISHLRVILPLADPRPRAERLAGAAELWEEGRRWLETHPARDLLERNLLGRAAARGLHGLRHDTVLAALRDSGARRVLDLGCGTGALLRQLLDEPQFEEVVGMEVVLGDLAVARSELPPGGRGRVMHGSLAYRDARLAGYHAAALVEVIEHMDPARLDACEGVVWETARPATVVVTTPNAEYNTLFSDARRTRHPDHRFEWTRAEFRAWGDGVASRHGYAVRYAPAGPEDPNVGPVTQMAIFSRLADSASEEDASSSPGGISLEDVVGERTIHTRRGASIHVRAEDAAETLETISRFAVDPRWLIHLPASPADAPMPGVDPDAQPAEALAFYRDRGVRAVALEELRLGTHVVAIVCRDADAAGRRFGVTADESGSVYTSSGQAYFATSEAEAAFLARLRGALDAGGVWEELQTDWVALEGVIEGMPVFREINPRLRPPAALYLALGAAGRVMADAEESALSQASDAGEDVADALARARERVSHNRMYLDACGRAFHAVRNAESLRFAPERILASQGAVHADRDPRWHRERLASACRAAPEVLRGTEQKVIDLADPAAAANAAAWWAEILARGGAGLIVRPLEASVEGQLLPPGLRCRAEDALRLANGPGPIPITTREDAEEGANHAAREWALSLEALDRFTAGEPIGRIHPCVFAALALKLGSRR